MWSNNDTGNIYDDLYFVYQYKEDNNKGFTQHINMYNPDIEIEQ